MSSLNNKHFSTSSLLTPLERRQWGELYYDNPEVMRLEICREQDAKTRQAVEQEQAKEFNKIITPLRDKLAELDKKLDDREADLINAKKEVVEEITYLHTLKENYFQCY